MKILILENASCKQNRPWLFTNSIQVFPESLLFGSAGVGRYCTNDLKCPEVLYKYQKPFESSLKPLLETSISHIHTDLAWWRLVCLKWNHTFDIKPLLEHPSFLSNGRVRNGVNLKKKKKITNMIDMFRHRIILSSESSDSSANCLGREQKKKNVQPSIARLLTATYWSEKIHVRKLFTITSWQRKCHYQLIQARDNFQAQR